tara:strand:+ start:219 stop:491 length:273 start_codon:yes stop_codon:yes gene_type:complete
MAKSPEERLAELKAAQDKIKAKIQQEQAKLRSKKRKDDTRRKIIIGAAVIAQAEQDEGFRSQLDQIVDGHTTRDIDRQFLGLQTRPKTGS